MPSSFTTRSGFDELLWLKGRLSPFASDYNCARSQQSTASTSLKRKERFKQPLLKVKNETSCRFGEEKIVELLRQLTSDAEILALMDAILCREKNVFKSYGERCLHSKWNGSEKCPLTKFFKSRLREAFTTEPVLLIDLKLFQLESMQST